MEKSATVNRVARGTTLFFFEKLINILLGFMKGVFIARLLGIDDYGLLAIIGSIVSLATVGIPKMENAIVRYSAEHFSKHQYHIVKKIFKDSLKYMLFPSTILVCILLIFSNSISAFYQYPQMSNLLIISSLNIISYALNQISFSIYNAFKMFEKQAYISLGSSIANFLVITSFLFLGYGIFGVIVGEVTTAFIPGIFNLIFASTIIYKLGASTDSKEPIKISRKLASYSVPFTFDAVSYLVYINAANLIIGYLYQLSDVGYFSLAFNIVGIPGILSFSLHKALFPSLSGLDKTKDMGLISDSYKKSQKYLLIYGALASGLLLLFAKNIILIFYGIKFFPSITLLMVLSLTVIPRVIGSPNASLFLSLEKPNVPILLYTVQRIAALILYLILIPLLSTLGAVLAITFSHFLILYPNYKVSKWFFKIRLPFSYLFKPILIIPITYLLTFLAFPILIVEVVIKLIIAIPIVLSFLVFTESITEYDIYFLKNVKTGFQVFDVLLNYIFRLLERLLVFFNKTKK